MNKPFFLAAAATLALSVVAHAQDASFWYRHPVAGIGPNGASLPTSPEPPETPEPTNQPPAITGVLAAISAAPGESIHPFTSVAVADPDPDDLLAVTLTISVPAAGTVTDGGGLVHQGAGVYAGSGTPADITASLRAFAFTSALGRLSPGASETVSFSLLVEDTNGASDTAATGVTITASANTAPVIAGEQSGLAAAPGAPVTPFATISVTDPEGDPVTITVEVDDPAKGSFSTLSGFADMGGGRFQITAEAGLASTSLQELVFTPAADRLAPDASETVQFTLTAEDVFEASTTASASITVTAPPNDPPVIAGVPTGLTVEVGSPITPFSAIAITDPEDDTVTVAMVVDDPAKGTLSALDEFVASYDVYTLRASPSAVTTALRGIVFTPTEGWLAPETSEPVAFSLMASDDHGSDVATVWVLVNAPAPPAPPEFCAGATVVGTRCSDGSYYAGIFRGYKLFAAAADNSNLLWRPGAGKTTNIEDTNDGVANTNAIAAAGLSLHPAAQACRNRGPEWYLPAENELIFLYDNLGQYEGMVTPYTINEYGFYMGGIQSDYWSSTARAGGSAYSTSVVTVSFNQYITPRSMTSAQMRTSVSTRCVRRGG